MKNKLISIYFTACLLSGSAHAQKTVADTLSKPKLKKFYVGSSMDGGIFSTATIQRPVIMFPNPYPAPVSNTTGTLRFSYVINWGVTFNWNLSSMFGVYTGVDIKNIGYIDNENGFTVKRRTYNIGAPIGIKIGNMMPKGIYGFLGGGADIPFNYKEKSFQVRNEKSKFNEWFSTRTPFVMPYVFAGASVYKGITVKFQYYPGNYLNQDYTQNGVKPYAGTTVHIMYASIGYAMPLGTHDMMKKKLEGMKTSK